MIKSESAKENWQTGLEDPQKIYFLLSSVLKNFKNFQGLIRCDHFYSNLVLFFFKLSFPTGQVLQ